MQYILYCDESEDKGVFYSNFYGGALLKAADREAIEAALRESMDGIKGEAKWTKITEQHEYAYLCFVDKIFDLVEAGRLKLRIMFTQNIHRTDHVQDYEADAKYFKLYYQFIKHAFGLMYCNDSDTIVRVGVYLDDAPDTKQALENFKDYLASLSTVPDFFRARVIIDRENIAEVNSKEHAILQAVDVVLGAMQFRLNEHHRAIPEGKSRRGKRTRAKERVYKHISRRLRKIYPNFNIGTTTGQEAGPKVRWTHHYRHWCFRPHQSVVDLSRGKKRRRK